MASSGLPIVESPWSGCLTGLESLLAPGAFSWLCLKLSRLLSGLALVQEADELGTGWSFHVADSWDLWKEPHVEPGQVILINAKHSLPEDSCTGAVGLSGFSIG